MIDLIIEKKNEVYLKISSETSVLYELRDLFTFYADGYRFHPKYRAKLWDGRIMLLRLISQNTAEIYHGLLDQIIDFCKNRNYSFEIKNNIDKKSEIDIENIKDFINNLKLSSKNIKIQPRDYQLKGFIDSIKNKRMLLLSPTSSGKSLIIYLISRYLIKKNLKGLIIVPNISLVHQMFSDFEDYSKFTDWESTEHIHKIYQGQDKESKKQLFFSTWQSLHLIKNNEYFDQFDFVITDEAHTAKASSLIEILTKCTKSLYRIGLTGTLDGLKINEKTLIGLFGPINKLNTTKELMDRKEIAAFDIKCLMLNYDQETAKAVRKFKYQEEIKFIVSNNKRNAFIKNLALSLNNNSIILCNFVETHGKVIYESILNSKHRGSRNVYFIHGGVEGEERERIRNIMENENDSIIVASSSIMSAGVSIRNLHNIIFAISGKSRIRTLQSIGRVLRLHQSKEKATLYDIVDNLSIGKHSNFTLNHFLERVKMYNQEKFNYKIINVDFKQ